MAGTPKIEIRDVRHVYTGGGLSIPALAGVNFTVADGEFVALLGPSGAA
jgi:ABC-type lipoprotein export system ATPase subunit